MRRIPQTFRPSPGKILAYHPPGGLGVRVDSAVYHGYTIPPFYDSLVGKLIVHGKTRGECLMRLKRALDEFVVDGVETTLPLFRTLVREKDIIDGDYHIHWLEEFLAKGKAWNRPEHRAVTARRGRSTWSSSTIFSKSSIRRSTRTIHCPATRNAQALDAPMAVADMHRRAADRLDPGRGIGERSASPP